MDGFKSISHEYANICPYEIYNFSAFYSVHAPHVYKMKDFYNSVEEMEVAAVNEKELWVKI